MFLGYVPFVNIKTHKIYNNEEKEGIGIHCLALEIGAGVGANSKYFSNS